MPLFKEVWHFESSPSGSWNEVYYSEAPTLDYAADFPPTLLQDRLNLLHPVNELAWIRVSDVQIPRVATVRPINRKGERFLSLVDADGPANLDEAAVITLSSTVVPASRKLWLRGMAETDVSRDRSTGQTIILPTFRGLIDAWIRRLASANNNYVIKTRTRVGQVDVVRGNIIKLAPSLNPTMTDITTDPVLNVGSGDRIVVNSADPKITPGLRGEFAVYGAIGGVITIPYRLPLDQVLTTVARGYVFRSLLRSGAIINPKASGFAYLGSRRSKNERTSSRGARRAQRLRQ